MRVKVYFFIGMFLLFHLHAFAGETITITKLATLKPVVSVSLPAANMQKDNAPDWLAVYMVIGDTVADIAVAGDYTLSKGELSFTPYNALGYGLQFEVQYKNSGVVVEKKRFTMPPAPPSGKSAEVVTAYPLADTIPYNTLFFHIRFSQPMMNDELAYNYVKVFDENGNERERAWRQRSFWLDEGRLLVLMIHPGRVKNGIHYESPLFDSGKRYTIRVEKDIKDINGNPIATAYTQQYYVGGEDRIKPEVIFSTSKLQHGSCGPLSISFSEGMDHASVWDGVAVTDAYGNSLPIKVTTNGNDKKYTITPTQPWQKGSYTLSLKSAVYDFAANRINRLFEIKDTNEIEKDKIVTTWKFEVK
jgi:hypothetical protein